MRRSRRFRPFRIRSFRGRRSRSYRGYRRYNNRRRSTAINPFVIVAAFVCVVALYALNAMYVFFANNIWIIIAAGIAALAVIIGYFAFKYIDRKYENFVAEHSIALRQLSELNSRYRFEPISNFDMANDYDNESFYIDISPLDYLTYQLVYKSKDVLNAIKAAENNAKLIRGYLQSIERIEIFDKYDTEVIPRFKRLRKSKEEKLFYNAVNIPTTTLSIKVTLNLTNINGTFKSCKYAIFGSDEVKQIIEKLSQRDGDFYTNEEVWQSICRVERGKVTNKMRFAVYNRDRNRCRFCGSTQNLEVDHIYPISKGGKSNFENLQTLCHSCNSLKSNTVMAGTKGPNTKRGESGRICEYCRAPLVLRNGKNGKFYGCPNYPKCNFTKNV